MTFKAFRYDRDLHVRDGESNGIVRAAERELGEGEYFVFPVGEPGTSHIVNGAIVQVNRDGTARLLRIA